MLSARVNTVSLVLHANTFHGWTMRKKILGTLDSSSNLRENFGAMVPSDDPLEIFGKMLCITGPEFENFFAGYAQTTPQSVDTCMTMGDALLLHYEGDAHLRTVHDGHVESSRAVLGGFCIQPRALPANFSWNGTVRNATYILSHALKHSVCDDLSNVDPDRIALRWVFNQHDPLFEDIGKAIIADLQGGSPLGRMYIDSLSQSLMLHLLRNYSTLARARALPENGLSSQQRERADAYMRAHIMRNITLAELAAAVNLSPSHFARRFKLSTGRAPHQYLVQLRVALARDLILGGGHALAMVAQQVGFADHSHMTRHFRDVLGITPRDLLKSARTFQK
jgi:AraC family transcriptional regulator